MRPLPAASEVIHPAPPQTSKRGGYGKSNLCGILISPPTAGKTVGHFEYSKSAQKRKRRARKVIKTFRTLIGAQAIFHFSPQAQVVLQRMLANLKSEIQPMGITHPLERFLIS